MKTLRKSRVALVLALTLLIVGALASAPLAQAAEPTSGNLVPNGDFSGGMSGWGWYLAPAAMAYRSIVNGELYVQIPDDGDATFHIQVNKWNLPVVNGRQYAVYFDAHSDSSTASRSST